MKRVSARLTATRRGFSIAFAIALLVGTAVGIAVYNLDKAYIASKFDLVSYVPDRLPAGGDSSILIMALDRDGQPIAGNDVEIRLEREGTSEVVWEGKTDESGFASPVIKMPSSSGKADIVVKSGTEEVRTRTVIDDSIRIIITTDKPVYRPGQVIHMRVVSFAGADPLPIESQLILEVLDPNGDKILKKQLTPNEFGVSSYDLALADHVTQGTYTIKASSGERESTRAVIVKDYVLPKFRVDILGSDNWYLVGQPISLTVDAEYFFGEPVMGSVNVNASVYYGVWTKVYSTYGYLSQGQFVFTIPAVQYAIGIPEAQGNGYIQVNVSVTDTGAHTETRSKVIPLARQSTVITVLTDSCVNGEASTFYAIVRTPDGKAVSNTSVSANTKTSQGLHVKSILARTDSRGVAKISFEYSGESWITFSSGYVSVSAPLGDGTGIKLIPDSSSYEVGQVGTFDVAYSGDSLTTNVYYDVVSRGFIVDRGVLQLANGHATLSIQMVPEMEPFAQVRVYKIETDMDVVRDAVTFSVGSGTELSVEIDADNASYYPRSEVSLGFKASIADEPVIAAMGVSVVDEAVFELDSQFQGFEELVFGLDQEFIVPQYQILSYVYAGSTSLPSASEYLVPELDEGRMEGTWEQNRAEAEALKESAIESYWLSVATVLGLGAIGVIGLSARRKISPAIILAVILVVPLLLVGILNVLVLGFGGSSSSPTLTPRSPNFDQRQFASDGLFERISPVADRETIAPNFYSFGGNASSPTIVRNYFPETWYWNPYLVTDAKGIANLTLQAPDSITTWKVDVLASTLNGDIGTANSTVRVFQPFFIDPDIPVSVVRGDEFQLKVQVYNYLGSAQTVNVSIVQEPWFTLLSEPTMSVSVPSNYVSFVTFTIKASAVGWHTVTLQGSAGNVTDAIVKEMRVAPDGTKKEVVLNGEVENGTIDRVLELDPQRIEGSEDAWVKLQGGIEAVLLDGVEAYIRFVTGCGEQSMSMLSIDVLAYDTVRRIGAPPETMFEYESMVNQGIQHELTFLTKDEYGRGIAYFTGEPVHPWLTAWGLVTFQDAINAGFGIDEDIIEDMQSWLMATQNDDGSWAYSQWGYHASGLGDSARLMAMTAYTARALIYSGVSTTDTHIAKAVGYIEGRVGEFWSDPYPLAMSALALELAQGSQEIRSEVTARLDALRLTDNGTYYWRSETNLASDPGRETDLIYIGQWLNPRIIETTGYAAMALHAQGGYGMVVEGAVKFLLDHRYYSGWASTQDTIVAFHTLHTVTGTSNIKDVTVKVSVNGTAIASISMGDFNKDVTYYVDLRPYLTNSTNVSIEASGIGTVLWSIYFVQYVPWPAEAPSSEELALRITYDATHIVQTERVNAHMYLLYNGTASIITMMLVDLRAPMGLAFDLSEFDALLTAGVIATYDYNERQVLVYLTDVRSGVPVEFDYTLVPLMPIKSTVQDQSAWDMYDPNGLRAETLPVQFEVT